MIFGKCKLHTTRSGVKKMVNGFRYRALESVSIASALSTALTIYPCQIQVHQRWQSELQLQLGRRSGGLACHSGQFTPCGYLSILWCVASLCDANFKHFFVI